VYACWPIRMSARNTMIVASGRLIAVRVNPIELSYRAALRPARTRSPAVGNSSPVAKLIADAALGRRKSCY
jgi:hypothetical protein